MAAFRSELSSAPVPARPRRFDPVFSSLVLVVASPVADLAFGVGNVAIAATPELSASIEARVRQ